MPVFGPTEVTSALKVTLWFNFDGLRFDNTAVFVAAFAMVNVRGTLVAEL